MSKALAICCVALAQYYYPAPPSRVPMFPMEQPRPLTREWRLPAYPRPHWYDYRYQLPRYPRYWERYR